MKAPRGEKARRAQEVRDMMAEYYVLRKNRAFEYLQPHPGPYELEDDPGLGVHVRYKGEVHEIYGLSFLNEAAKKGKHTELTCTCVDGWCEELCFPKIHDEGR